MLGAARFEVAFPRRQTQIGIFRDVARPGLKLAERCARVLVGFVDHLRRRDFVGGGDVSVAILRDVGIERAAVRDGCDVEACAIGAQIIHEHVVPSLVDVLASFVARLDVFGLEAVTVRGVGHDVETFEDALDEARGGGKRALGEADTSGVTNLGGQRANLRVHSDRGMVGLVAEMNAAAPESRGAKVLIDAVQRNHSSHRENTRGNRGHACD